MADRSREQELRLKQTENGASREFAGGTGGAGEESRVRIMAQPPPPPLHETRRNVDDHVYKNIRSS